ncbi:regulator of gluconeogenesis [Niveomyces insectorum RCEF 264]|uniref:GID complex catalytic subunit 2 n=1 Tax=Niveomyces insectorum RCEF 264 TaxID=1081102 RepID=A0A167Y8R2_9HYPO|nr:regulator of gluconeogenesis [Niveomyces insectorum RCEF 264]
MADNMPGLHAELAKISQRARLTSAVEDVDSVIARLLEAREKVALEQDPHAASLVLTRLQNPIKEGFEKINDDLKAVSKTQKEFGKALDRSFPVTALPTDHDVMEEHPALINRAIAMHLLREGHFGVARTFMDEARDMAVAGTGPQPAEARENGSHTNGADDGEDENDDDESGDDGDGDGDDTAMTNGQTHGAENSSSISNFTRIESLHLQEKFELMYAVLKDIQAYDLASAITWARANAAALEARGSNLEFELCKLQFIWLAKTTPTAAAAATAAAATAAAGPTRPSFTREFCALLGLAAESPLYLAATAGVIALPRLLKFIGATRSKRTEWTTASELAFETPLPASLLYHSIFVCPVSKEQTTDRNPPMRLRCGHVLAYDSLQNMAKGTKYKCPYCPDEAQLKDTRQIIL